MGWNDAGLSVTGNELDPNDERIGIPRLLQVRDVLTRTTSESPMWNFWVRLAIPYTPAAPSTPSRCPVNQTVV